MTRMMIAVAVALLGCLAVSSATRAEPQPEARTEQRVSSDPIMNFYREKKPEALSNFFRGWRKSPASAQWAAYPPLAGFLSVAFAAQPAILDDLAAGGVDARMRETFRAAARLSGDPKLAKRVEPIVGDADGDPKLKAEFAGLPRITELKVASASHLDILWGAAFASGDPRYVRQIIDFAATMTNRSEQIAVDCALLAVAMSGGPKDIFAELKSRYGEQGMRELAVASSALWALGSNARRHEFVKQALAAEVKRRAGTSAGWALAAFLPRPAGSR